MRDDVKLVEGQPRIGQMFVDALDESRRHVDADRAELFGVATVLAKIGGEAFNRAGIPRTGS
ncbi:hypothetical protein PTKU15_84410 [Paraburkholderia terrae]|nr:hypothetical protein PTKU15_84410 [Paraburkholderia terrae]